MSLMSESESKSERVEQIWRGWNRCGQNRTVWRVADNLEKTLLCKFFNFFKTRYSYNVDVKYNIES